MGFSERNAGQGIDRFNNPGLSVKLNTPSPLQGEGT
jgi:hypothetical protein